jgi:hypothetical protein
MPIPGTSVNGPEAMHWAPVDGIMWVAKVKHRKGT